MAFSNTSGEAPAFAAVRAVEWLSIDICQASTIFLLRLLTLF